MFFIEIKIGDYLVENQYHLKLVDQLLLNYVQFSNFVLVG